MRSASTAAAAATWPVFIVGRLREPVSPEDLKKHPLTAGKKQWTRSLGATCWASRNFSAWLWPRIYGLWPFAGIVKLHVRLLLLPLIYACSSCCRRYSLSSPGRGRGRCSQPFV